MEIEVSSNRGSGQVNPPNMHNGNKGDESLVFLAWKDLTVLLPNLGNNIPAKKLLNGLSGFAEPGKIMAVMGPSGSGKSTLLDSLAGRLPRNVVMSGNVIINGKKKRLGDHIVSHKDRILLAASAVAYVTQDDLLLGTLTVKETLTYSAKLRLPSMITKQEIHEIVEGTMMEMGLQECADNLIGNWHLRGISGGEKKRLSIALEILTRPSLLFLDEPTSGLDSASAFFVVEALRSIARDGQRTIIASIHQPSSEVFALFDDLFLLSGGEAVYFGEAKMAVEFFHEAGIPCPTRRNPADHFLRCINSDFDAVTATLIGSNRTLDRTTDPSDPLKIFPTAEIKAKLVEKYKTSQYATRARARTEQISTMAKYLQEGKLSRLEGGSKATWWKQLVTLTRRSFVNMSRDLGYYWLRVIIYSAVSISVGTIFFDIGTSYTAIFARGACGGFVSGFMTFMSIGGFPSFIEELKVFHRERLNGHYGVAVYILSNFLSSFPFLAAMSVICVTITYFMVKMRSGFSFFLYDCFDLTSSIAIVESCMMIVAALVPNYLMGIITGAGLIGIMMLTAGFFRTLHDLPKPIWRYPISYINYQAWALQGAYKNDMIGLEFDPLVPGDPKLRGEDILKDMLGVPLNQSKWWDLTAVLAILISYRLAFFAILKLKERAIPLLQSFYAKRTIKHLDKGPLFPSTRQYNSHSLSSQEDLNSSMN